ncbi:MAG: hypothetical protein FNT29_10815 [Halothiobacillaceae bacterium]|nr:MAG: hypothetical protein FNT29_10815 [Halothiobacillaceae bacterium]
MLHPKPANLEVNAHAPKEADFSELAQCRGWLACGAPHASPKVVTPFLTMSLSAAFTPGFNIFINFTSRLSTPGRFTTTAATNPD